MSGLELQRKLVATGFPLPIVIVTDHGDVTRAVQALKVGAFHFIEKPFKEQALLDTVEAALGRARNDLELEARRRDVAARLASLSARKTKVLHGILAGRTNKLIAQNLNLSVKTIEIHRAAVMA